jgi:hypothetical protein
MKTIAAEPCRQLLSEEALSCLGLEITTFAQGLFPYLRRALSTGTVATPVNFWPSFFRASCNDNREEIDPIALVSSSMVKVTGLSWVNSSDALTAA